MIPVFSPDIRSADVEEVVAALRRGEVSGSFGQAIPMFENAVARMVGCKHAIAVSNGTTALHLACVIMGLKPGDEVLVPASTNIATALAVAHCGAIPVPVDSDDACWNLSLEDAAKKITPRTRGILPVHLFGYPVDMDALADLARAHGLWVVEDCAESHGATVRGRVTGSLSNVGCFSFYANKIVTTGEGGMLTTNDDTLAERARLYRNLGFREPRFVHDVLAFNYRMTGMQAALGVAQMARFEEIVEAKIRVARTYQRELADVRGVRFAKEPDFGRSVFWVVAVEITPEFGVTRDALAKALQAKGIETRTFFCPMNQQPALRALDGFPADACPVADRIWRTGMYLPSSPTLSDDDIRTVCAVIREMAA